MKILIVVRWRDTGTRTQPWDRVHYDVTRFVVWVTFTL